MRAKVKRSDAVDKHVGRRVRMRRMKLGMSQRALAGALGITYQQVQKDEKGINRIGAGRLQQISRILEVPAAFFFRGAPHLGGKRPSLSLKATPSARSVSTFLATSDGLALIKAFMHISDARLRRCIVALVKDIAATRMSDRHVRPLANLRDGD